jgi:hypothetical protein
MPGYASISGLIVGVNAGSTSLGPFTTLANTSADFQSGSVLLVSGPNTITVPPWAAGVIIIPNPANIVGLTLKGVSGDTGITIAAVSACMLSFGGSPPASFVLTAAANFVTYTQIIFY